MDKQTATQLIGNTFNYPFDEGRFRNFAINLLNDVDEGKKFVLLNGFTKKTRKTPKKEIKIAQKRKRDYEEKNKC